MCGISGVINFRGINRLAESKVKIITENIAHRGPDNSGYYKDDYVCFGHRRLSIVDLSSEANQPMIDSEGDVVLVFNGEIYNQQEIRSELEAEYKFATSHSDTETIIYCYKKWGIKGINKFIGMFAIAIYDKNLKKCFLIRDRLGKKPLYYTTDSRGDLYFCSEVQPFFKAEVLEKEINDEALYHYLSILTVDAPKTFFKNIYKVESGTYVELDFKEKKENVYWNVSDYINRELKVNKAQATRKSEVLLRNSMIHRSVSDVPIVIALSGGLDSSLNLKYIKSIQDNIDNIQALNLSYSQGSKYDESQIAHKFSKEQDVDINMMKIDKNDFEKLIDDYLRIQKDVPSGDINTALVYGMSKEVRNNQCKVMIVGEGGDELGGYPIYTKLNLINKILKFTPNLVLKLISLFSRKIKNETEIYLNNSDYSIRRFIFGFREYEKREFWIRPSTYNTYELLSKYSNEIKIKSKDSYLRKLLNIEYKVRLAELILPRIDYPSMAASIEARAPFMDHLLIEYTSSLPFNLKMENGAKTIIKDIANNNLPQYIMTQPKVGFGQLMKPFFETTLPDWYKKEILDQESPLSEYVAQGFLQKLYENKNYDYRMWLLFSLNRWLCANR